MIKSVVVSLIALSVAFVPVAAEARDRDGYRGGNHSEQREHKRSRINTGEAIAIGVGALILGAAIGSNSRNTRTVEPDVYGREVPTSPGREVYDREYNYHYRRQYDTRTCYKEFQPLYDSYGRIVQYAKITTCY
jgi:hypothetical protein